MLLKKIKKNKIIIKSSNINILSKIKIKILNVRPINIFNKRGLRGSKSLIYVKKGKKSS